MSIFNRKKEQNPLPSAQNAPEIPLPEEPAADLTELPSPDAVPAPEEKAADWQPAVPAPEEPDPIPAEPEPIPAEPQAALSERERRKQYVKLARKEARTYLSEKRDARRNGGKKEFKKRWKSRKKTWRKSLRKLEDSEKDVQRSAFKAFRKRKNLTGRILGWILLLLILAALVYFRQPILSWCKSSLTAWLESGEPAAQTQIAEPEPAAASEAAETPAEKPTAAPAPEPTPEPTPESTPAPAPTPAKPSKTENGIIHL